MCRVLGATLAGVASWYGTPRSHRSRLARLLDRARLATARRYATNALLGPAPSPPVVPPDTRTIADVAWLYELDVIGPETYATDEQRQRALTYVSQQIVPLVGHVRVCDVTPELERGVGAVLYAQCESYGPPHVWKDLLRITRSHYRREQLSHQRKVCRACGRSLPLNRFDYARPPALADDCDRCTNWGTY